MIVSAVMDRAEHAARLADPDGYRPEVCGHCRHTRLHVHDYPERVVRGDAEVPVVRVVRYRCARCTATWRILPGFVCVRLPRRWATVEAAVQSPHEPSRRGARIPKRTRRRWRRRLRTSARVAVAALGASGNARLGRIAARAGLRARRADLVAAFASGSMALGAAFATAAATLWRLVPGLRVM